MLFLSLVLILPAVRLVLATVNAFALCLIRRGVSRRFGRTTSIFFTLLTCSQFHLMFWMGRTLPNMFALVPGMAQHQHGFIFLILPPVNIASFLLVDCAPKAHAPPRRNLAFAIGLLTFAAIVFRAELVLLLGPLVLQSLFLGHISFVEIIKTGVIAGVPSLGQLYFRFISFSMDSLPSAVGHRLLQGHLPISGQSYCWELSCFHPPYVSSNLHGQFPSIFHTVARTFSCSQSFTSHNLILSFLLGSALTFVHHSPHGHSRLLLLANATEPSMARVRKHLLQCRRGSRL